MNITYHTPPADLMEISPDESAVQDEISLDSVQVPFARLTGNGCPPEEKISDQDKPETRAVLETVFESSFEDLTRIQASTEKTASPSCPLIRVEGPPSHDELETEHGGATLSNSLLADEGPRSCLARSNNANDISSMATSETTESSRLLSQDSALPSDVTKYEQRLSPNTTTGSKEQKLSELMYREAIEALRISGKERQRLGMQSLLGELLQSCDRNSEALYLLIGTLIELFTMTDSSVELMNVIECIAKLHTKMAVHFKMVGTTARFFELAQIIHSKEAGLLYWPDLPEYTDLWVKFTQLGSCYSQMRWFLIADRCFAFPPPPPRAYTSPGRYARFQVELTRFRKECCLHYQRQGKISESLIQLRYAFEDMRISRLGIEQYDQDLATILDQILAESMPKGNIILGSDRLADWESAYKARQMLIWDRMPSVLSITKLPPYSQRLTTMRGLSRASSGLSIESRLEQEYPQFLDTTRGLSRASSRFSIESRREQEYPPAVTTTKGLSRASSGFSIESVSSRLGLTYSVGSASIVSNSEFMVP